MVSIHVASRCSETRSAQLAPRGLEVGDRTSHSELGVQGRTLRTKCTGLAAQSPKCHQAWDEVGPWQTAVNVSYCE